MQRVPLFQLEVTELLIRATELLPTKDETLLLGGNTLQDGRVRKTAVAGVREGVEPKGMRPGTETPYTASSNMTPSGRIKK